MTLTIVPCTADYWEFVRQLRTDPRCKPAFIQQGEIRKDEHRLFMMDHRKSYLIALLDGKPAGFAGSVKGDVRVCVDPDYQRRGVGKFLLQELLKKFPGSQAKVKVENLPSQKLFESCGWVERYKVYEHP
jgi:GNAT superfamily N-acetyltransferase